MFTRRSSFSLRSARMSRAGCQFSVVILSYQLSAQGFTENGELRTDNLMGGEEKEGGKSVHRATYCAHTSPLPLLPSGPGGVGGITSRGTPMILTLPNGLPGRGNATFARQIQRQ